jgi:hypothetical protein
MNDSPEQHIVHQIIPPQGHGLLSHSRDRGSRNPIVLGPATSGMHQPDMVMNGGIPHQSMPVGPEPLGMQQK